MKKILIKYLPIVAAVLLATACSKDENNDTIDDTAQPATEQPTQSDEVVSGNYVTVPFSVKVDNGTSLSKIAYTETDGEKGKILTRVLQPEDVNKISLHLSGYGINPIDLPLQSTNEGGSVNYYFVGQIEVESAQVQAFNNGEITLYGSFSTTPDAPITYSTTSLEHLATNCAHVYKASFASNADNVMFTDQNAYLAVSIPTRKDQTVSLSVNGIPTDYPLNSEGKNWIAVGDGTTISITDLDINDKMAEAGHIYNINTVYVTGIKLSASEKTSTVNGAGMYICVQSFTPSNCNIKKVDWTYDDPNNVVQLHYKYDTEIYFYPKAAGSITVTATARDGSGVTATCIITVTE